MPCISESGRHETEIETMMDRGSLLKIQFLSCKRCGHVMLRDEFLVRGLGYFWTPWRRAGTDRPATPVLKNWVNKYAATNRMNKIRAEQRANPIPSQMPGYAGP